MKDEKPIVQSFILPPSAFILYEKEVRPMEQPKKEWVKPELLVLVRNKPEERVLVACKSSTPPTEGPGNAYGLCQYYTGQCNAQAVS